MKNIIKVFIVSSVLLLNSCASNVRRNIYDLSYNINFEVSKNKEQKQIAELKKKVLVSEDERPLKYQDDLINTEWILDREGFWFSIKNKTQSKMKIIWKDAYFSDGESGTIDIRKYNIDSHRTEVTILPDSFYEDYIYPYKSSKYSYFPVKIVTSASVKSKLVAESLEDIYDKFVNKPVQIYVPIEIDEKIYEYRFIFNVNEVKLDD